MTSLDSTDCLAGFEHIRQNPTLRALILLAIVPTVLALPYQQLMPVFARDVYDVGAVGEAANAALRGGLDVAETASIEEAVAAMEAALRRHRLRG